VREPRGAASGNATVRPGPRAGRWQPPRFRPQIRANGRLSPGLDALEQGKAARQADWGLRFGFFRTIRRPPQTGAISSVGRALRLHRRCREFESLIAHHTNLIKSNFSLPMRNASRQAEAKIMCAEKVITPAAETRKTFDARPSQAPVDDDRLIETAMARLPTVHAILAK
jgi:hypothetical protein